MADQGVSRRQTPAMAATAAGGLTSCLGYFPVDKGVSDDDGATTIHVKPEESPLNSGAPDDALTSTDRATDFADPGDTVYVHPGEYTELVDLTTGGSPGEPFTLTGPPDAVLRPPRGKGSARAGYQRELHIFDRSDHHRASRSGRDGGPRLVPSG